MPKSSRGGLARPQNTLPFQTADGAHHGFSSALRRVFVERRSTPFNATHTLMERPPRRLEYRIHSFLARNRWKRGSLPC